jgi:hypothetical protein
MKQIIAKQITNEVPCGAKDSKTQNKEKPERDSFAIL